MNNCDMNRNRYEYENKNEKEVPVPFVLNAEYAALHNSYYRKVVWTGCNMQMTVMCIPECGEIGAEVHECTDQLIRVECGRAVVSVGSCSSDMNSKKLLCKGDVVLIPAGVWHNIMNSGKEPLKVSSVYAPPEHAAGEIQKVRESCEAKDGYNVDKAECGCMERRYEAEQNECGCMERRYEAEQNECGCMEERHENEENECGCMERRYENEKNECGCMERRYENEKNECGCMERRCEAEQNECGCMEGRYEMKNAGCGMEVRYDMRNNGRCFSDKR